MIGKISSIIQRFYGRYNTRLIKEKIVFIHHLNLMVKKADYSNTFDSERKKWKKIFIKHINECNESEFDAFKEVLRGFFEEKITLLFKSETFDDYSSAILICSIKNDLKYLDAFLSHYRNIGVKNFIFVDNNSSDGSIDFLRKQNDVTVFSARYSFTGRKKAGWRLQVIAQIGLDHWYLWLDSDEFFAYPHMEKIPISGLIDSLEDKRIDCLRGFLLDMYPKYEMMDGLHSDEKFLDDYVYYDKENMFYHLVGKELSGGMRERLMHIENLKLDKIPLAYCSKGVIFVGNHAIYPKKKQKRCEYGCVLKHYKFLPSDFRKYKTISDNGGGGYYSLDIQNKYVNAKDEGSLQAFCDASVPYKRSEDLLEFSFMRDFLVEKHNEEKEY